MKDVNIYRLSNNIALWLIDINMDDDIESHRYYFIDSNYQMKRVKSIDTLLEFLDKKNIELIKLSNIEIYNLYKKSLKNQNINYKKIYDKPNKDYQKINNYPGLAKMIDYDLKIINNKFQENLDNDNSYKKNNVKEKKEWYNE